MPSKIPPAMLAVLVIGLAVIFVVVWPPYLATLDGPQHIYYSYILKTWPALNDWYDRSLPVGSVGFPALFLPLTLILPWAWAYRVALGLMVMLWCISSIALAKALHPGRMIAAVLGGTLVLGWALAMGFFSFVVGTAISVLALASALDPEPSRRSMFKTQLLLSLAAVAHLFAGALGIGAVILAYIFQEESARDKLLRLASRIVFPLVVVLFLVALTRQDALATGENMYLADTDRFLSISKMGFGGPLWRALPPTLIAAFAAVWCLALAKNKKGDRREWGLALLVLGGFVMAMLAPLHLPGWMHFAPRFLPMALLIGVSLVPFERLHKQEATIAAASMVVFALASIAWFGDHFRKISVAVEPLLAVTRAPVQRTGLRLPILSSDPWFVGIGTMDVPFPFADPAYNIPLLVAVEQGGVVPYTFTTVQWLHPFVDKRDHPPSPAIPQREHFWLGLVDPEVRTKPNLRRALLVDVASRASRFEDVILFGSVEDQKIFDDLGFDSNWRSDAGYIATFQGCRATLGIKAADDAPTKLVVAYGWFPIMKPMWRAAVTRNGALTTVELPGAPCGPIWIDVQSEETPVACAGAQRDGRLIVMERTNQKGIVCALQIPAR